MKIDWRKLMREEYGDNIIPAIVAFIPGLLAWVKAGIFGSFERKAQRVVQEAETNGCWSFYPRWVGDQLQWMDYQIRRKYAEQVANRVCRGCSTTAKRIFVELRMTKLWKHCVDSSTAVALAEAMESVVPSNYALRDVWAIGWTNCRYPFKLDDLIWLLRKGAKVEYVCALIRTLCPRLRADGPQVGNRVFGPMYGEQFSRICWGIRKGHINYFWTYLNVIKRSHIIAPTITSRYLKVLQGLSPVELSRTLFDTRNWAVRELDYERSARMSFRLRVVAPTLKSWQPLFSHQKTNQQWLIKVGRVPQEKLLRTIGINGFTAAEAKLLTKEYMRLKKEIHEKKGSEIIGEHDIMALRNLLNWFGKDYRTILSITSEGSEVNKIHDRGINLTAAPFVDGIIFLKRYKHSWENALKVINAWSLLRENGVNPLAKGGLEMANKFFISLRYKNVTSIDLAVECGKWAISQDRFENFQSMWVDRDFQVEYIPKVTLSNGDWKFYTLDRMDPRGPFLGHYTNCCQHPEGAGASCALYGTTEPTSGFVVLEYRGEVKFQSWIWRDGSALVFDNVEGGCKAELYEEAKTIYLEGIKSFIGKFNIDRCYVGTSRSDISYRELRVKDNPCSLRTSKYIYSDARSVWVAHEPLNTPEYEFPY